MTPRAEAILHAIPKSGKGIEYGPLSRPLVPRSGPRQVRYVDFNTREMLIEAYKRSDAVDTDLIPEIDIVTGGRPIDEFIEPESLDFIVASHVAEHVPDLIGWLDSNLSLLRPGGRIALAHPDRRYCFDIGKQPSMISDLIAARLEGRTRPTFQQICDHHFNNRQVTPHDIWSKGINADNAPFVHPRKSVLRLLARVSQTDAYFDVHCWKFSDAEFRTMLQQVQELFDLEFAIVASRPTKLNTSEFHITLERPSRKSLASNVT